MELTNMNITPLGQEGEKRLVFNAEVPELQVKD
jgi:hypothetical protein